MNFMSHISVLIVQKWATKSSTWGHCLTFIAYSVCQLKGQAWWYHRAADWGYNVSCCVFESFGNFGVAEGGRDIDHYHRIIPLYLQKFFSVFAIVGAFILTAVVIINFNWSCSKVLSICDENVCSAATLNKLCYVQPEIASCSRRVPTWAYLIWNHSLLDSACLNFCVFKRLKVNTNSTVYFVILRRWNLYNMLVRRQSSSSNSGQDTTSYNWKRTIT